MITVIGLGFVGLTTALGFSDKGFKVYGYDIDKEKINSIKNNKLPFFEDGLDKVLERNLNKNCKISDDIKTALKNSKIIFLCVGTPTDEYGKTDLKHIKLALDSILSNIEKEDKKILVIKSTVPPATLSKDLSSYIENNGYKINQDIYLVSNPEFLREGCAWNDFIHPDRIVIGIDDEYPKEILNEIYKLFNTNIHYVSTNTSEFIKYLSNTFLATLISYSNEMSMVADAIGGIDIKTAFKIFQEDKRWFGSPANMQTYAYPGCGFGGYCLPKDTLALYQKAKENNYDAKIIDNILEMNTKIKTFWVNKIKKSVKKEDIITILGLSFKPNSDDVRQTPSLDIIKLLLENGYKNIIAYDPLANDIFDKTYNLPIKYANSLEDAIKNSSHLVIATAWEEFKEKKDLFKNKNVYDMRYIL